MSLHREFHYTDLDGNHLPDTYKGSELYYEVSFSDWVTLGSNQVMAFTVNVQGIGIAITDHFHDEDGILYVKIRADYIGVHKINIAMKYSDGTYDLVKTANYVLRVN